MIHAVFKGVALCGFIRSSGQGPAENLAVPVTPGQSVHIDPDQVKNWCPECLPLVCGPEILTIHILDSNTDEPLCGFRRGPFESCYPDWPEGHTGATMNDHSINPNCPACLRVLHTPRRTSWDHVMSEDLADEIDMTTAEGYMLRDGKDPDEARQRYFSRKG